MYWLYSLTTALMCAVAAAQQQHVMYNGSTEMRSNPERGFRDELDDFCGWEDAQGNPHWDVNGCVC